MESFSIIIGAIIAYWITYGTMDIQSHLAWRLPFGLQMVPALCVGIGIHFFPFSPRWLCMRDRDEDSLRSLTKLRRLPAEDDKIQLEWKGIIAEVALERELQQRRHPGSSGIGLELKGWYDLFTRRYRKRTIVACAIPFFQQFSGKSSSDRFIMCGAAANML